MKNSIASNATVHNVYTFILIMISGGISLNTVHADEPIKKTMRGNSTGCGIPQLVTGDFVTHKMSILSENRTYHLRVPRNYDRNRAYPVIFRWHGAPGNGLSEGMNIETISEEDAIIVGADGMNKVWNARSDFMDLLFNTTPINILFFDSMLDTLEKKYCIDRDRIFSYGFSQGATFANLLACERADVLRGSAVIAGLRRPSAIVAAWRRGGYCKGDGKVAVWFLHDVDDEVVPVKKGRAVRDWAIAVNGCSKDTVIESDSCVRYKGCEAAPVVWCETKGFGHNIRSDFAPEKVWSFFSTLH